MAYSDTVGDNARLLSRTIRGVGDFSGRSRRTEVVYYWIAWALVGVMLNFSASVALPFEAAIWFGYALYLLFLVPMFALFVRRLHDQERSGWWGLLLPLYVVLRIPRALIEAGGDVQAIFAYKMTPVAIASSLVGLAILVLCLLPGSDGPNRYGADPRLDEV